MNCLECIYGYYYDTCNADWADKTYAKMLKEHKCPYYNYGHNEYLKVVKLEE